MTPDATMQPAVPTPSLATATWPEAVPARRVERAMDLLRAHLVEGTAHNDWNDDRIHELARAIVMCMRQSADVPWETPRAPDARLSREHLRRALQFINANLDGKLDWVRIADAVGLSPF